MLDNTQSLKINKVIVSNNFEVLDNHFMSQIFRSGWISHPKLWINVRKPAACFPLTHKKNVANCTTYVLSSCHELHCMADVTNVYVY